MSGQVEIAAWGNNNNTFSHVSVWNLVLIWRFIITAHIDFMATIGPVCIYTWWWIIDVYQIRNRLYTSMSKACLNYFCVLKINLKWKDATFSTDGDWITLNSLFTYSAKSLKCHNLSECTILSALFFIFLFKPSVSCKTSKASV